MKNNKPSRKRKSFSSFRMYGFNKSKPNEVGWFSKELTITDDVENAKEFISENIHHIKGFGSPKKWLEFINSDRSLNHGYEFHLVKINKKSCRPKGKPTA